MGRTSKTFTFTLPPDEAEELGAWLKERNIAPGAFAREAVRRYLRDCRWQEIFAYGEAQAKKMGIKPEDVPRLVEEVRAEMAAEAAEAAKSSGASV